MNLAVGATPGHPKGRRDGKVVTGNQKSLSLVVTCLSWAMTELRGKGRVKKP